MMKKEIFCTDKALNPKEIVKRYEYLAQLINVQSQLIFTIEGLREAVNSLPSPNKEVTISKFGLNSGVYLESNEDVLKDEWNSARTLIDVESVVKDSLNLLAREEYRIYYDEMIDSGLKCFTSTNKVSRLIQFRYLQLLMDILDKKSYEIMYDYDCCLSLLWQTIEKNLSKEEALCITESYGLITGIRNSPHYIVARFHDIVSSSTEVAACLQSALSTLREKEIEYLG